MPRPARPLLAAVLAVLLLAGAAPATASPPRSPVPEVELKATVHLVDTMSDGRYSLLLLLHSPDPDPATFAGKQLTIQGVTLDGAPLGREVKGTAFERPNRSKLAGYEWEYWVGASGVSLEMHHQAPLVVRLVDAPAPYRLSVPEGQPGNAVADAVRLFTKAEGNFITLKHHRGEGECRFDRVLVTVGTTTQELPWTPTASGGSCVGRIPAPEVEATTSVQLHLPAPGEPVGTRTVVSAPLTVEVARTITPTGEEVAVTSTPGAVRTTLQRWEEGSWVKEEVVESSTATFTVPVAAEPVRYRISVYGGLYRSFTGAEFVVAP